MRLYDPEREEWSLYWVSSRTGKLTTPVVGRFADGRGEFYGDDVLAGKEIRVRYIWSGITAESARTLGSYLGPRERGTTRPVS